VGFLKKGKHKELIKKKAQEVRGEKSAPKGQRVAQGRDAEYLKGTEESLQKRGGGGGVNQSDLK